MSIVKRGNSIDVEMNNEEGIKKKNIKIIGKEVGKKIEIEKRI